MLSTGLYLRQHLRLLDLLQEFVGYHQLRLLLEAKTAVEGVEHAQAA